LKQGSCFSVGFVALNVSGNAIFQHLSRGLDRYIAGLNLTPERNLSQGERCNPMRALFEIGHNAPYFAHETASAGGLFHVFANNSAPAGVKRTNVPLSWITSQPRSIASFNAGAVLRGARLVLGQKSPIDILDVDPCRLAPARWYLRSAANFMQRPYSFFATISALAVCLGSFAQRFLSASNRSRPACFNASTRSAPPGKLRAFSKAASAAFQSASSAIFLDPPRPEAIQPQSIEGININAAAGVSVT
jgi:hypothetical protein